jgi:GT2 family glycosyltransferase
MNRINNITNMEKIAFCITCMNRLNHLQQTLEKNIQDNYLIGQVEFILLDYNSKDGLEEWVYNNMMKYIDEGILIYYKNTEPEHYLRSHSRNMAFRLANAAILCNLDADNFLGKGFADSMLREFSKCKDIFYTNNYSIRDTFGKFCVRHEDFDSINGYNEALQGYGYEDADIFNRLRNNGLKQIFFDNPEYYHHLKHSYKERISEESRSKNLYEMYISYINPYISCILLLNKDYTMEQYTLVANQQLNVLLEFSDIRNSQIDERNRTVIQEDMIIGTWSEDNDTIHIQENRIEYKIQKELSPFNYKGLLFYKLQKDEIQAIVIELITDAINYKEANKYIKNNLVINPDGYGNGTVYKNFNFSNKIIIL